MITYREAMRLIEAHVAPLDIETRDVELSLGAATGERLGSRLLVPPFANAAMDGFALRAVDTAGAGASDPLRLPVAGVVAAGDAPRAAPPPGAAVEIMTGAPLPDGCDAVVPIERVATEQDGSGAIAAIRLDAPVESGRNVRRAGEDFERGTRVLESGLRIEPHAIMALAATGVDEVDCRPAPRVAVITTGSELAERGAPEAAGMIRNSNGPYLDACIEFLGARRIRRTHAPDQPAALDAAIAAAADAADVVLTTGGVSAGRYDLIPDAVARVGGEILFHKVGIRPGKPLLFARMPGGTLLFGLPGNPIAAAVGLRFFVVPALRRLQGLGPERFIAAVSDERIAKRAQLCFFGKAAARVDADGCVRVRLLPGQESFKIRPLTEANCWAVVPEGTEVVEPGALIDVAPLYPTSFLQD